jgi:hypothetical protein
MPTKAELRSSPLRWMTMTVAYELGKTEEEVTHWPINTLKRWWTFFLVKADLEKEALAKAKARARR